MVDTSTDDPFGIDRFPVGCLATDGTRTIRFANAHAAAQVERPREDLPGLGFETLLTPASRIFCDSYIFPMLLREGHCDEIALKLATGSGARVSVLVNACIHDATPDLVLWSFMRADKRNQLQDDVLNARNELQKQAHALKEMATRDELTGLLNRREFRRRKTQMISAADRTGTSVMLFLLDIDRFKRVNDTYGHLAGDDVLRQLGAAFSQVVRTHELAARYGGEEFVFAITTDNVEAARQFSRRLHAAAANVTGSAAPLTVSVGVSCRTPGSGKTLKDLAKAADDALYQAKDRGRNRSILESGGVMLPFD